MYTTRAKLYYVYDIISKISKQASIHKTFYTHRPIWCVFVFVYTESVRLCMSLCVHTSGSKHIYNAGRELKLAICE